MVVLDAVLFAELAFSSRVKECAELAEIRTHVNHAARKHIEGFLGIVETTATVPAVLRALIREHREYLRALARPSLPA
jgi:hypothetical protein